MNVYTGIGSRSTPDDVLSYMEEIAEHLAAQGWILRSGAAPGADSAFERGALRPPDHLLPEVYLPWAGFEGRQGPEYIESPQSEAFEVAACFHPVWNRLSRPAHCFHARNAHQVLGRDVTQPVLSKFVLCWTPGGSGRGGTGQAIRIADAYGVPVYDLGRESVRSLLDSAPPWALEKSSQS